MKFKYLGKVPLCNNRADRGIYIHGFCLPLCARCTGILAGSIAGTIILKAGKKKLSQVTGLAGVAMLVPTAVDGVVEYVYGRSSRIIDRKIKEQDCLDWRRVLDLY